MAPVPSSTQQEEVPTDPRGKEENPVWERACLGIQIELLEPTPLFAELPGEALKLISSVTAERNYAAGASLFEAGSDSKGVFLSNPVAFA